MQIKVFGDSFLHLAPMISFKIRPPIAHLAAKALFLALAALLLGGCGEKTERAENKARHYEMRGLVRGLPPDHKTIEVEHEAVPGYMAAMTMPFEVRDKKTLAQFKLGDAIAFRLNVTAQDSWIDRIRQIDPSELRLAKASAPSETPAAQSASPRFREGDILPAWQLVDEDGKAIGNDMLRGHPFVLTFIFTRCPIPDFCPRMSQNFAELQKAIKSGTGTLAETRLLSISFDPEFDTPTVLKAYGEREQADPAIWSFATGPEVPVLTRGFSVLVQPESGTISHSLATALIDRAGRIKKIWRGNAWTVKEVTDEIAQLP
jgi:protein SCO1/2